MYESRSLKGEGEKDRKETEGIGIEGFWDSGQGGSRERVLRYSYGVVLSVLLVRLV